MNRSTTFGIVLVAVMAAVIAALGIVPPIPVGALAVPITLQSMGAMLAGALLGPVRGPLSAAVVAVLAAAGLPVLAGGRGGLGVVLGPTGGFIIGWIAGALVIGLLVKFWAIRIDGRVARTAALAISCLVGGIGGVYAVGVPWWAVVSGLPLDRTAVLSLVFVPGDLIKAVIAALVATAVHRSYRRLI